jgi:hypothetical protein
VSSGRPIALTIVSVLGFSFGLLGLCCMPFQVYSVLAQDSNPAFAMLGDTTLLRTWTWVATPIGLVNTILLLVGSAGVYGLHGWGRTCIYAYAALTVLFSCIGSVISLVVFAPVFEGFDPSRPDPLAWGMMGGAIGGSCGAVFGMVIPLAYVGILMMESSRRAFAEAAGESW